MGDSHFKSNIIAKEGTETISGFATISATALTGDVTGNLTGSTANHVQFGNCYIFSGGLNIEASVVGAATALTATPTGSLYLNTDGGGAWYFDGATSATKLTLT